MTTVAAIVFLINNILGMYIFVLMARIILSWLLGFGILNSSNKFVALIHNASAAMVDPVLAKIRKVLPFLVVGGMDLSPIVLYFLIQVVQIVLIGIVVH